MVAAAISDELAPAIDKQFACLPAWVSPDPDKQKRVIALAFYSAGLRFHVIENPSVQVALTLSNHPDALLPTVQELSTTLLDAACGQEHSDLVKELKKHRLLTLMSDGWTSSKSTKTVDFGVEATVMMRLLLWTTIRVHMAEIDGEYVATVIGQSIDEIEGFVGKGKI